MRIVTPTEFKDAFHAAMTKNEKSIIGVWKGSLAKFTEAIREVLADLAIALRLELHNRDYYTLDAIFYESKDIEHFPERATYAKYVAIALEHENRVTGSETEIHKLQLINTPLKVLITYAQDGAINWYLDRYAKIIRNADVFNDVSDKRRQLVIFGSCDGTKTYWEFYVFSHNMFIRI